MGKGIYPLASKNSYLNTDSKNLYKNISNGDDVNNMIGDRISYFASQVTPVCESLLNKPETTISIGEIGILYIPTFSKAYGIQFAFIKYGYNFEIYVRVNNALKFSDWTKLH